MQFTPNQTFALYPQLGKTRPFTSPSPGAFTEKVGDCSSGTDEQVQWLMIRTRLCNFTPTCCRAD